MTHPPIIQSYQQPYIIDDPIPAAQHRTSAFCCHIIASFPCLHPTAHKAISFLPSFLLALSVSDQSPMFPVPSSSVLSKEEQDALVATPVHPAGLVAGNLSEHVWNFTWPAAVAMLHPSLLPVAVVSFFSKIVLGQLINRFSSGVLDRSMSPQTCDKPLTAFTLINLRKIGENSTL
ncbi:hypothetical protein GW17_00001269 [Ensete ventricosum]|nr:hypothetical protein GW17_00001269 [Ensete ventricosum]